MNLDFNSACSRQVVFAGVAAVLEQKGLRVSHTDHARPWGGFFVMEESDAPAFIQAFFPHLTQEALSISGKLSPKILVVAPHKRLSWQYHHRRAEIWKLIGGTAGVVTSDTDEEKDTTYLRIGDIIQLRQGERHRLIGLEGWGILAEIWQHTDAAHPSDEDDIVRVQDDFGR